MKNLTLSFLERILPRAASALVMVLLAAYLSPEIVGVYALGTLAIFLLQAASDNPMRQMAVKVLRTTGGMLFMRRYVIIVSALGTTLFLLFVIALVFLLPSGLADDALLLLPLAFVPSLAAIRMKNVAQLQLRGLWPELARGQMWAALLSLAVSVPVLVGTKSILASSLQIVLTEAIYSWYVRRAASHSRVKSEDSQANGTLFSEFRHVAAYSLLGWGQSQADKGLLSIFAGPAVFGMYSFAQSIARSAGDSLSTASANVLRPVVLGGSHTIREVRKLAEPVIQRGVLLSACAGLATVLAAEYLLRNILSEEWGPALDAVRIMTIGVVPTMVGWSLTVLLLALGRVKWASPIKFLGVLAAVPIAFSAIYSLELAAWLVVAREALVMMLLLGVAPTVLGRRTLVYILIAFSLLAGVALTFGR
ncbi:oligosaccharide flippase family protein [Arthrobacter sp. EH-1B-1]|uniref:Oligosaccharide flippase family protein n=1 Tax=Arthrobacter vasquezii TaxID=2977629 RepID=A0ABT6CXB4_9MICC|nr:oligosaccharide flippase family protein [Arthrobacter vasquezii]MDF9278734.1 oligosaccharide flippase family protein [Arthrobacter vasquezii]